jgi:DNA modification methylase
MQNKELTIVQVAVNKLKPALYNPRRMDSDQLSSLTDSIKQYGFVDPLVVNNYAGREQVLVGGHQRFKVAKSLGYKTVPVVYVELDEMRERELNLRLNRTGEWDLDLLKAYDTELLLNVGFGDAELGDIWDDSLEVSEDEDYDAAKAVKQAQSTDIKPGDMFQLGKHRLICGDATDKAVIAKLVADVKPTMLYADPPYNIGLDYNKGIGLKAGYGGTTNDNKSVTEYQQFLSDVLEAALSNLGVNAHIFMYCDQNYIGLLQSLMTEHGLKNRRVCMWIKNGFNVTPQVAFNKAYEPCVYATLGKPYLSDKNQNLTELLNKDIAVGNRTIDDITDYFDIWLAKRESASDYQHPTQKPTTLHEKPLKRCTKIGDAVLDVFGGSGSTLIACEQMQRVAYLCEIEPVFCQVIIDRWEKLTGDKAVKL